MAIFRWNIIDFDEILYAVADWDHNETYHQNQKLKNQYGERMPYRKTNFGYHSTTVSPIWAKFCKKMRNSTTLTVKRQKFQILEIFKMADAFAQER